MLNNKSIPGGYSKASLQRIEIESRATAQLPLAHLSRPVMGLHIFNDRPAIDLQLCRNPEMRLQCYCFFDNNSSIVWRVFHFAREQAPE